MPLLLSVGEQRIGVGFLLVLLETALLIRIAVTIPSTIPLVLRVDVVAAVQTETTRLGI